MGPFGLGRLSGQLAGDRVEVDQRCGPRGLQSGLRAADVAGLASAVPMREQAQEPLDPRSCASEVLGGGRIGERLTARQEKVLVWTQIDLTSPASGATTRFERALAADRCRETRLAKPGLGRADRDGLPARTGDRASVQVDRELVL